MARSPQFYSGGRPVPYYSCPRCRLSYYSAASWAYVPECPRCYQPLNRPSHVRDRVVSIARRTRREGRDREPSDGSTREGRSESGIYIPPHRPVLAYSAEQERVPDE